MFLWTSFHPKWQELFIIYSVYYFSSHFFLFLMLVSLSTSSLIPVSCLWVSQWNVMGGHVPDNPLLLLLLLILSAGNDTCVSSVLKPSVNFTGRLKIKQGLPSLPVAQENLCVCVCVCSSTKVLLHWDWNVHVDVWVCKDSFLALGLHIRHPCDLLLIFVTSHSKC